MLLNVFWFMLIKSAIDKEYNSSSIAFISEILAGIWILVTLETLYFPEYQEVKYLKRNLKVTVRHYIQWLLIPCPESNGLNNSLKNSPKVILVLSFFPARLVSSSSLWHHSSSFHLDANRRYLFQGSLFDMDSFVYPAKASTLDRSLSDGEPL